MKMNFLMSLCLCVAMALWGCKQDGAQQEEAANGGNASNVTTSTSANPDPEGPQFKPSDPAKFDESRPRMVARKMADTPTEGDGYLETAIRKQFTAEELSEMSDDDKRYGYSKIDLNEDQTPEIIVGLTGPRFCKDGMCKVFVFQEPSPKKYVLIGNIEGVVMPFFIYEKDRLNKWAYLVSQDRFGEFRMYSFNGTQYDVDARKMSGEQEVVVSLATAFNSPLRFLK